jgi:predicted ABC-class ATPase
MHKKAWLQKVQRTVKAWLRDLYKQDARDLLMKRHVTLLSQRNALLEGLPWSAVKPRTKHTVSIRTSLP